VCKKVETTFGKVRSRLGAFAGHLSLSAGFAETGAIGSKPRIRMNALICGLDPELA